MSIRGPAPLKALKLDESLAEAHTSLGLVKFVYDWDWAGAESEFKRAIQLNPNYPSAYHFYSAYLICVPKRFDEAIAVAKQRGIELDPLSIPLNNILANHLDQAGRYDEAIEQRRRSFAKRRLQKFNGISSHTFYLHLKECEWRFNNRSKNLYAELLKLLRNHPL